MWIFFFFFFFPFVLFAEIEQLKLHILSKIPHSLPAFTQGLSIEEDHLYESTGLYGQSSVRQIDLSTGRVIKFSYVSKELFGEGLAALSDKIIQVTWKEGKALIYDRLSFKLDHTITYSGEGWGLCKEGENLWMSNGTSLLTERNGKTFLPLRTLNVVYHEKPLLFLNDLESVGTHLFANVWGENVIVRIDKGTGNVTAEIDAAPLLGQLGGRKLSSDEVLNGIAYRKKTDTFILTGKNWPYFFEVKFVP